MRVRVLARSPQTFTAPPKSIAIQEHTPARSRAAGAISAAHRRPMASSAIASCRPRATRPGSSSTSAIVWTGPLAQFSRSNLVRDIASRLMGVFAQNVEAQLTGAQERAPEAEFDAGGLFVSAVADRIKSLLRRIFGRKNSPR